MPDLQPLNLNTHVDRIRASVAQAIDAADTGPDALMILGAIQTVQAALKDLKKMADQRLIEITDRTGEFCIGAVRYYIGTDRDYKPRDNQAVLEAVLHVACGDVKRTAEFLNSDPWKPSAIRDALKEDGTPELFDKLFETVTKRESKTGKPKRIIKSTNPMLV